MRKLNAVGVCCKLPFRAPPGGIQPITDLADRPPVFVWHRPASKAAWPVAPGRRGVWACCAPPRCGTPAPPRSLHTCMQTAQPQENTSATNQSVAPSHWSSWGILVSTCIMYTLYCTCTLRYKKKHNFIKWGFFPTYINHLLLRDHTGGNDVDHDTVIRALVVLGWTNSVGQSYAKALQLAVCWHCLEYSDTGIHLQLI